MDIQVSSNFERFLFEATGRDAAFVRGKMNGVARRAASIGLGEAIVPYREAFIAERVDQAAVADCIRAGARRRAAICSTRTAPARVVAARKTLTAQTRHIPHIALATAHPAKFPDAMQAITGERPALPPRLAAADVGPGTRHRAAQRSRAPSSASSRACARNRQGAAA